MRVPLVKRTTRALLALLVGTACLAACTLGPDFVRPPAPAVSRYTAPAADSTAARAPGLEYGAPVAADWYLVFHSTALDGLIARALVGNPGLEAARHALRAAQDESRATAGLLYPAVTAGAGANRGHINGSGLYEPDQAFSATGNQRSLGLSLAYNMDLFGQVHRSVEAQRAAVETARYEALSVYITLVSQVVTTAFDAVAAQAEIDATQSLLQELEAQCSLLEKLEAAGKINHGDGLLAQTELETTRAALPALEQLRDTARNALARLAGAAPTDFQFPPLTLSDFALPVDLPVSLPSALVRQRPDILAAESALHQASAQIGIAEAARYPSLSLSAQYARQSSALEDLFKQPGSVWSVGVNSLAPLYSGGALSARASEAKQIYLQRKANYRATVLGAFVEVADALQALEHDTATFAARSRALAAAQANLTLAAAQYRAGKYNELQVLLVEQQYRNAALTQVQADARRFTDVAALFHALGGGWWNAEGDPAAGDPAAGDPAALPPLSPRAALAPASNAGTSAAREGATP